MTHLNDVEDRIHELFHRHFKKVAHFPGGVIADQNGTGVFATVEPHPTYEYATVVHLEAPILGDIGPDQDIARFVGSHSDDHVFCHLAGGLGPENTQRVFLAHRILGDFFDDLDIVMAVREMHEAASELKDQFVASAWPSPFRPSYRPMSDERDPRRAADTDRDSSGDWVWE